jgi:hypothetical protein
MVFFLSLLESVSEISGLRFLSSAGMLLNPGDGLRLCLSARQILKSQCRILKKNPFREIAVFSPGFQRLMTTKNNDNFSL